jgi:two-component system NtrC family sensor kinase
MFTAVIRDITERVEAMAELQALNKELKRQQEALIQHEKMAAMGQMAAGVAHEISNPLANIHGVLQLVERYPDRMTADVIDSLREQAKRIDRIIRQMAYFAHPAETCWELTPINELVEQSLGMIRFDHRIRQVELVRNLSPTAGEASLMRHALHQVLVNIIINALDAVTGRPEPRLELATRREEKWCVIEISDNGRGIKPENLERIFEPFFTTKPVGEGTGLGLSISYSLIERHGGRFEVESTVGEGTTFSIRLPIDQKPS